MKIYILRETIFNGGTRINFSYFKSKDKALSTLTEIRNRIKNLPVVKLRGDNDSITILNDQEEYFQYKKFIDTGDRILCIWCSYFIYEDNLVED